MTLATVVYLLPWQFAQFSLATQAASLFFTYSLGFMNRDKLGAYIRTQTCALLVSYVLMFTNSMLVTSLFASLLCAIWVILLLDNYFGTNNWQKSLKSKIAGAILANTLLLLLTYSFKKFVLQFIVSNSQLAEDDSHIWDILKAKFSIGHHTFDTRLYTCSREFDFLEVVTLKKLTSTHVLTLAIVNFVFYGLLIAYKFIFSTVGDDKSLKANR